MIGVLVALYIALVFAGFACLRFMHKYNMAKINLDYWKDVSGLMEKNRDFYKNNYHEAMDLVKEAMDISFPSIDTEVQKESKERGE